MRKVYIDYLSEEKLARHNELLAMAEELKKEYKATHKTERKPKGPMTIEQKIKAAEMRMAKTQAKIDALMGLMATEKAE